MRCAPQACSIMISGASLGMLQCRDAAGSVMPRCVKTDGAKGSLTSYLHLKGSRTPMLEPEAAPGSWATEAFLEGGDSCRMIPALLR